MAFRIVRFHTFCAGLVVAGLLTASFSSTAATLSSFIIDFSDGGTASTTGDLLDQKRQTDLPLTVGVVEAPGLFLTVTAFTGLAGPNPNTPDDIDVVGSGLGINSGSNAPDGEQPSQFDPGESLTFSFSESLLVDEIAFASITGDEAGRLTIGSAVFELTAATTNGSDVEFAVPLEVAANTNFIIEGVSGLFRLTDLTAKVNPTVIPEPASLGLLGLGGMVLMIRRRSRDQEDD